MSRLDTAFTQRLIKRLGKLAMEKARPGVNRASITLERAMNLFQPDENTIRLQIPHYWALYVHDGRGPFGPIRARSIVFFRVPLLDPRLRAGVTPVRAHQIRRLTIAEWEYWKDQNKQARARGETPPMVVIPYVKKSMRGRFFFGNEPGQGMHGFMEQANAEGMKMLREHIAKRVPGAFTVVKDRAIAKL